MSVEKYRDFLDYWDSRLDENEKILNNYPQLANFAFRECNKVWNMLIHDYAALLARHNALVEAVKKEQICFITYYSWLPRSTQQDWENWKSARTEVNKLLQEPI